MKKPTASGLIGIILLLASINLFTACSDGKEKNSVLLPAETELPPSLREKNGLKIVKLTASQQQDLNVKLHQVSSSMLDFTIEAPGVVFPAPEHASMISTPINGQVHEIKKFEGQSVQKNEVLFHIQSLEFGTLVSEYLQAHAEQQFQTNRLRRVMQLVEETISSASELERTTSEFERTSASVRAAYSRLKALGVTDKEIQAFTSAEDIDPILQIHSPISGIVEQNFIELGQSVNAFENLSRILDTHVVLIRGYISPEDARLISSGDSVTIMKRQYNGDLKTIAKVTSINPGLDENSRSVVVNVLADASKGWPRPGENVRLEIKASSQRERIAVPVESLTYDGNQAVVFVHKGEGIYECTPIKITEIGGKQIFVETGLKIDDEIAASNVFSLKALMRYDIISEE